MYYAVAIGRKSGIYKTWDECNKQVNKYSNAIYKKFNNKEDALQFINKHKINNNIIPDYYVYTDGSCFNNGNTNAIAGIGIFFGINDSRNVSKIISGKQTNNTAELKAIIETYNIIKNDIESGKNITIVSDSKYAIACATLYGKKCSKINYMKKGKCIPNKELVQLIYETYKDIKNVQFMHCKAHTNNKDIHSLGNEGADKLANKAIKLYIPKKIYINVVFSKKDQIKKLGGKWNPEKKKWFIYDDNINKNKIIKQFN